MAINTYKIQPVILGLIKKPFVRNVATVATGTAAAQVIGILFSPIITRLYGPEAFGLLGMFISIVAIFTPIAALCYPIAIVLPKRDEDAKALIKISAYISFGIALLVTISLLIGGDWLLELIGAEAISAFKLLIPLNILFVVWLQIAKQWLIRKKQFKVQAKVEIAQATIVNGVKTGIGFFHPLAAVLIALFSFGHILHASMLCIGVQRKDGKTEKEKQNERKISLKSIASRYIQFPLYQAPRGLLDSISQSIPILLLAAFFGPAPAGFYALGRRILKAPSQLISNSIGTVLYPKIAEAAQNGVNFNQLIVKATWYLAIVGFLPFILIALWGPWIFGFIFGTEWIQAGEYARWISLYIYTGFIKSPSNKAIIVLKKQHLVFALHLATIFLRIGAFLIGAVWFNSGLVAVAGFALIGVFHNIFIILIASNKSKR